MWPLNLSVVHQKDHGLNNLEYKLYKKTFKLFKLKTSYESHIDCGPSIQGQAKIKLLFVWNSLPPH